MSKATELIDMFEMANLWPNRTGLSVYIWVDDAGKARKNKHSKPRVKVALQDTNNPVASVSIDKEPKILEGELKPSIFKQVSNWLVLNLDILMQHWNGDIDIADVLANIKKT